MSFGGGCGGGGVDEAQPKKAPSLLPPGDFDLASSDEAERLLAMVDGVLDTVSKDILDLRWLYREPFLVGIEFTSSSYSVSSGENSLECATTFLGVIVLSEKLLWDTRRSGFIISWCVFGYCSDDRVERVGIIGVVWTFIGNLDKEA